MKIHLSKPGGERTGPFTVEEINAGLAQRRFRDTDYWAWYDGLESWVPLHQVPGIIEVPEPISKAAEKTTPNLAPPDDDTSVITKTAGTGTTKKAETASAAKSPLQSGLPIEALEQIFLFTDGEGATAMRSPFAATVLKEVIGTGLDGIREQVPRGVFGKCDIAQRLREDNRVPDSAWRAMSAMKPDLVKLAHAGEYKICVRTFDAEAGQKVAAFLFYNKSKVK